MNDKSMLLLEELVNRLQRASKNLKKALGDRFVGLMLFGSYARGEASEESDVDVLVVLRGLEGFKARSEIYSILAEHIKKPVTLIDVELEEVSKKELEVTPLLLNILYDGQIIYDESGILRRLKDNAFKLVKKAQLVRYRTPNGKYGWKRADGKPLEVVET
ncbi:MAG: nucleotidyltransferase domain-containing protein [Thermoprotei archaeon]|nr:MAG: nucleotidyltransferase domain-containing protein [Thermoprotei archaeon]